MAGKQQNPREGGTEFVARMLAVVPFLIENSPVTVTETAETFSTTPQDIRAIVRTLFVTGIPGDFGVGLPDDLFDFDFDLFEADDVIDMTHHVGPAQMPRFSGTEAAALIAGLQYVSEAVRPSEQAGVTALIEKISRGSTGRPAEVQVETAPIPRGSRDVVTAIESDRQVSFLYHNAAHVLETRRVDPLRLDLTGNVWYLRGYCHLRQGLRTFRLDRMRDLQVLDRHREKTLDDAEIPDVSFDVAPDGTDMTVTVTLSESAVPLVSEYSAELENARDGRASGTIMVAHEASLKRLVSRVPGGIEVDGPEEARRTVREWATECVEHHSRTASSDTA